jgi:phage terminase small subunit
VGEVTKPLPTAAEVLAKLRKLNPGAKVEVLVRYADAFSQYQEAAENLARCGTITAHPRTGAPLENPYLRVRNQASQVLAGIKVCTGDLWD